MIKCVYDVWFLCIEQHSRFDMLDITSSLGVCVCVCVYTHSHTQTHTQGDANQVLYMYMYVCIDKERIHLCT